MNFQDLRTRVASIFASRRTPSIEQNQRSAAQAREDRASSVVELRRQVRQLQQDITDASDAAENGTAPSGTEGRIAALRIQLEKKQAELATFQARI